MNSVQTRRYRPLRSLDANPTFEELHAVLRDREWLRNPEDKADQVAREVLRALRDPADKKR